MQKIFFKTATLFLISSTVLCLMQRAHAQQSETITYTYDKLNRLTGVAYSSGAAIIYIYDAAGNRISLQVTGGSSNPTIINLSPGFVSAGIAPFTLTVNGSNFESNSVVQWNGANRGTTFISSTQLNASILASDVAAPAVANITVVSPGNLASNTATFTINDGTIGTRILTIGSSNPAAGVSITVSPNDINGAASGTSTFSRTYSNNTTVTLTAPASAAGNSFLKWQRNGLDWSLTQSTTVMMDANYTMTAVFVPPPTIFTEEGTNNAIAVDSVTFVRGPFRLTNPFNFGIDQRTRVILFTSDLGLSQPNPTVLSVQASGVILPAENVGTVTGVPGLSASYVIVRLPDNLPAGSLQLTITLRGITSNLTRLDIAP